MQKNKVNVKRRRLCDFPELQVGFPERNDVSMPEEDIVRVDAELTNLEMPGSPRNRTTGRRQEIRETKVSRA